MTMFKWQRQGVPYWQMVFRHALPNALLPTINVVALTIAWLLGGVVVIEVVFNYPGLGRMMIDAISDRDLPVVQAIALIVASIYVCVNLTADLMTMIANPKLRTMYSKMMSTAALVEHPAKRQRYVVVLLRCNESPVWRNRAVTCRVSCLSPLSSAR